MAPSTLCRRWPSTSTLVVGSAGDAEVRFGPDGQVACAREMAHVSYDTAERRVAEQPTRLSTLDEW